MVSEQDINRNFQFKVLKIIWSTVKALIEVKPQHAYPSFDHLKLLDLGLHVHISEWMKLLHVVPSLESLKLSVGFSEQDFDLEQVEPMPVCMSRLKEVTLFYFMGEGYQVEVAKIFLKNANNLEKMFIYDTFDGHRPESAIKNMMTELPRTSSCLSIVCHSIDRVPEYCTSFWLIGFSRNVGE